MSTAPQLKTYSQKNSLFAPTPYHSSDDAAAALESCKGYFPSARGPGRRLYRWNKFVALEKRGGTRRLMMRKAPLIRSKPGSGEAIY